MINNGRIRAHSHYPSFLPLSPSSISFIVQIVCISFIQTFVFVRKTVYPPAPGQIQLLLPYNPLVSRIPDGSNRTVRTQVLTILWSGSFTLETTSVTPVSVTLSPFARCCCQTTHSNTSSTIWLPICRPTYCIPSQHGSASSLLLVAACHAIILSSYSSLQSPGHSFGFKLHLADL